MSGFPPLCSLGEAASQGDERILGRSDVVAQRRRTVEDRAAARARAGIATLWVEGLGHPGRPLAAVLGVRPQAAYQAVARGRGQVHGAALPGSFSHTPGGIPTPPASSPGWSTCGQVLRTTCFQ